MSEAYVYVSRTRRASAKRKHCALLLHAIQHVDASAFDRLAFDQFQIDLSHLQKQRDARAEQDGVDIQADFIDHAGFEQRSGELAAAHAADVLAAAILQIADEFGGV